MRATAYLSVEADPCLPQRSRISRLRSDAPIVLRPTRPIGLQAIDGRSLLSGATHVCLVAGAAGPVGGDRFFLGVDVGPDAALVLRTAAATLVLPGPHQAPSYSETEIRVAAGGTLAWLPGPIIAARGCDHYATTRVELQPGARLLLREELVLGRHGERPGAIRQRLRVTTAGHPLHDQELRAGPDAIGWDGAAVTGGRKTVGSLLAVDPDRQNPMRDAADAPEAGAAADAAVVSLTASATLVMVLADDAVMLRRRLDAASRIWTHSEVISP